LLRSYCFWFQEELDLSAVNKAAMLGLPNEKKWQIYCSQRAGDDRANLTNNSNKPEVYIEKVRSLAMVSQGLPHLPTYQILIWRRWLNCPRRRATLLCARQTALFPRTMHNFRPALLSARNRAFDSYQMAIQVTKVVFVG
jgi:hypothetical protein